MNYSILIDLTGGKWRSLNALSVLARAYEREWLNMQPTKILVVTPAFAMRLRALGVTNFRIGGE